MNPVLQEKLLRDIDVRSYCETTKKHYLLHIKSVENYFEKPVESLTSEELLSYQYYLLKERKLSEQTVNQKMASIRFLFRITLDRREIVEKLPYVKVPHKLPTVLSRSEMRDLLLAGETRKEQIILAALYDTGLRLGELLRLKPVHIDKSRMMIHVQRGKGRKDRYVPLSQPLRQRLLYYWFNYRPKDVDSDYIFAGKTKTGHITRESVQKMVKRCSKKAGITKKVSPHTLRHTFATHQLEAGIDLRRIQVMLGHATLHMTMRYVHVASDFLNKISSPLSELFAKPEGAR